MLSYVNTKLRDEYGSLDELCDGSEADRNEIEERLRAAGYTYNEEQNRFM